MALQLLEFRQIEESKQRSLRRRNLEGITGKTGGVESQSLATKCSEKEYQMLLRDWRGRAKRIHHEFPKMENQDLDKSCFGEMVGTKSFLGWREKGGSNWLFYEEEQGNSAIEGGWWRASCLFVWLISRFTGFVYFYCFLNRKIFWNVSKQIGVI